MWKVLLLSVWVSFSCFANVKLSESGRVELGVDRFFREKIYESLKGKHIGVMTNHTGYSCGTISTVDLFLQHKDIYILDAFFVAEQVFKVAVEQQNRLGILRQKKEFLFGVFMGTLDGPLKRCSAVLRS